MICPAEVMLTRNWHPDKKSCSATRTAKEEPTAQPIIPNVSAPKASTSPAPPAARPRRSSPPRFGARRYKLPRLPASAGSDPHRPIASPARTLAARRNPLEAQPQPPWQPSSRSPRLNHIRSALGIGRVSLNQQELVLVGDTQSCRVATLRPGGFSA